jgi:O-antigen ligase
MRAFAFKLSLLFIFVIPWEGVEVGTLGTVAKPIGTMVAAFWVVSIVIKRRFREPTQFQIAVFLFVLWNALSVMWSADPERTLAQAVTWAQLFVFVFMVWDLYTTRAAVLAGLQAYVLGAYVALGSALFNFLAGVSYYTHYDRFSAGDTNPDGFGFILALGMPVAWFLASSESTSKATKYLKVINYAYVPAALLGISLSGTRSALIATVPAMLFGLASLARLRLWIRNAILVFLASAIFIMLPLVQAMRSFQRFSTIADELSQGDLNNRINNWREGLTSFERHPITGVGGNMYRSVNSLGKVAHNSYLSVLVEVGLIGFALFGIILTIALLNALGQPGWDKSFWLSLLAVWSIGACALTWEDRKSTWLFLSLIVASAAVSRQRDERPDDEAPAAVPA